MQKTPFYAYYLARKLENLPNEEKVIPVFASSNIKAYPFQIGAARFALHSSHQAGAILCDEAGMGKSHEAMLIITQKWLEGQDRILVAIPNGDLLMQWTQMLDDFYTVPYVVVTNRKEWNANCSDDTPNAFYQDAIVITTYDFVANHEQDAKDVPWDLTVFEEASALSSVYQEENKQAKALHRIAGNSFKILLTGTPIEKNIMDLYGLIWFIDPNALPGEREFLARYLRRPENYPELSRYVSQYCFRTLRSQAKQYAKVPRRILITDEYSPSTKERALYELLYEYIEKPNKIAFPEMNRYDLALRLLGLQSSSTAAILQTIKRVIKRLERIPNAKDEMSEWKKMQLAAEEVRQDAKAKQLLAALKKGFALLKSRGAKKKAVIFTQSIETQKMLQKLLSKQYRTLCYNGSADYSVINEFRQEAEVLISTDNGARGFNLQEAALIIHYDLLYNTLKMEQRIDRCQRLGQENDVLSLAFIDKNNFADVRKLELVNKRMLVADGVFGITDEVVGGFSHSLDAGFAEAEKKMRSRVQIEEDFQQTLVTNKTENQRMVTAAEDILFTTFTKELADKVKLSPQYISQKADEMNAALWEIAKCFFEQYNAEHDDCYFEIDEEAQTITATNYEKLPTLFYYATGGRNRPYQSLKAYGMAKDFKPRYGRITFSSIIGRGILREMECAEFGECKIDNAPCGVENAEIGLYTVQLISASCGTVKEIPVLVGKTQSGEVLSEEQCLHLLSLPAQNISEQGRKTPHWLKSSGRNHPLDKLVPIEELLAKQEAFAPALAKEIDKLKQQTKAKKEGLGLDLRDLEMQIQAVELELGDATEDRLKRLTLEKRVNKLRQERMKRKESQFFDAMRLDMELEEQIKALMEKDKLAAKATREFVVQVTGNR